MADFITVWLPRPGMLDPVSACASHLLLPG